MRVLIDVSVAPTGKFHLGRARTLGAMSTSMMLIGPAYSFANVVQGWARLGRDLGRILYPALLVVAIPAVPLAVIFSRGRIF